MTALDETFRAQRAALRDQTVSAAAQIWQAQHENRDRYLAQVLTTVEGAQRAMVTLTSGYLTAKARETGHARFKALKLGDYTVAKLRGTSGPDVYGRVYGALYGQLNAGASEEQAHRSALDALSKLAATDLQMALTAAARDWMAGDKQISGYKRVVSGTCDYCEAAAEGLYHSTVQLPLHENCDCTLEPLFGAAAVAATGLAFHAIGAGQVAPHEAGDLEARLDTTGDVPAPPKKRRRR